MIKIEDIKTIAAARGELPALVSADYTLSWSTLCASVQHLVQVLRDLCAERAITQGAFVSSNRPDLVTVMSAFASEGIPLAGIDYTLAPEAIARALQSIGADFLIVASSALAPGAAAALAQAVRCRVIDLDGRLPGAVALSTLQLPRRAPALQPGPRPPFRSVLFTSGTSGDPKPVLRSRSIDARRFAYFTQRYGFHSQDRFLVSIPLYHVAGSGWARNFMSLGATLYLGPVEQPEAQAEWVLQHGITATVTTPPSISRLARTLARAGRQRDTQLRFVLVGGKNLSPSQKHQLLETLGPVVYEYYGSTETGVNTIAEPADLMACPESVGRPYDGNRVVILDEAGRLLPAGLQGRVAVSSYLMMDHYADGSANDTRIDGERFLLTPDAGFFDAQGRLHVLNRACGKDGNFDTYGVEEQLRALPDIVDLAVMVRTDAPDGARVADCGFTLAPQASAVQLRSQVRAFLKNAGLVPRHVEALAAIPYSLSGKVRWSELERLLREAQPPRAVAA